VEQQQQQPQQQLLRLHNTHLGLPHQHPHLPPHSHLQLDPSLIPLTHPAAATAYSYHQHQQQHQHPHQQHKRTASSAEADVAVKRRRSDAAVLSSAGLHAPPEYLPSPTTVSVSELEYAPSQAANEYVPPSAGTSAPGEYAQNPAEYPPPPDGFSASTAPYGDARQEYATLTQSTASGEHQARNQAEQADGDALDEEPLYVNAKQYHRILKRRGARARLEEVHRLSKERKVRFVSCVDKIEAHSAGHS
jgi:hypothetical protein